MDESLVAQSVFFDSAYYCAQLPSALPSGLTPAAHYLNHGWRQGFDPGPLFSTLRYLWRNEDVRHAGMNPLLHYVRHGLAEGRRAWSSPEVMRWQRPWLDHPDLALEETEKTAGEWPRLARGDRVLICCHSQGHFVFRQFQEMLVQAFESIGIEAIAADESFPATSAIPAQVLVLAPHDFFCLPGAPDVADPRFAEAILINTEQMPSRWFARILRLLFKAPYVLDMNVQTAASLCRLGIRARFLPLGHVPVNEIFQDESSAQDRDIDLLWIGSNSKRRQDWLGQHQAALRRHQAFVRLVGVVGALSAGNPSAISPMQYARLARRAKIQLNIHHFNMPYFEWQRIVHYGLMQGNCVVTEASPRVPGLSPGVHYLEADKDKIPSLVDWLLGSVDGQAKLQEVRLAGQKAALEKFDLGRTLCGLFRVAG